MKTRIVNGLVWGLDHIKDITILGAIVSGLVLLGPPITTGLVAYQNNSLSWLKTHNPNCGNLTVCIDQNGTITSVRDYSVECDTWFSRATCPRENLGINVAQTSFNQTINCHFYSNGDKVLTTEKLDYFPVQNRTDVSWSLKGGPC